MASQTIVSSALPLHHPLPLSSAQETQVRDLFYKRVRSRCANEIRDFAACVYGRTITTAWACRERRLTMNACMIAHDNQEEKDAARLEWFATIDKRAAERVEKEKKKAEQEKFHREWWGLPPKEESEGRGKLMDAKPVGSGESL